LIVRWHVDCKCVKFVYFQTCALTPLNRYCRFIILLNEVGILKRLIATLLEVFAVIFVYTDGFLGATNFLPTTFSFAYWQEWQVSANSG